jgi:hypothetical protein
LAVILLWRQNTVTTDMPSNLTQLIAYMTPKAELWSKPYRRPILRLCKMAAKETTAKLPQRTFLQLRQRSIHRLHHKHVLIKNQTFFKGKVSNETT